MSVTTSITDDDVFTALRTFLISIVPSGVEVIQNQDNGVPMPDGPFATMNNVGQRRLATNVTAYDSAGQTKAVEADTEYTMQVDLYGPDSGAWATAVQTLFRDPYAVDMFPDNIKPLSADDPIQIPLINAENCWEQRWRVRCVMQTCPVITLPQQSATAAHIDLYVVDAHK